MAVLLFASLFYMPSLGNRASAQVEGGATAADQLVIDLTFTPSIVESGAASYPIGFVQLIMNNTGSPVLAPRDLEIELNSRNAAIVSVPAKVVIPKGSDYVVFDVSVSDTTGESEVSALFGNQIVTRTFKVAEAVSQIPDDIDLVINLPSESMQIGSEMPISVYLENNGNILQAPEDVSVSLDYDRALVQLSSSKLTIKKGDYYALATVRSLEKSGNAFIKAQTAEPALDTVTTVEISQTQPASLQTFVFPEKIAQSEDYIDVFVGLLDNSGTPTVASQDITLELFASSSSVLEIGLVDAVIKKGEFGYHLRQPVFFSANVTGVTVGATTSGLGVSTDSFDVVLDSLNPTSPKAEDRVLTVYTVGSMPSDATAPVAYQINAVEVDCDDFDYEGDDPCPVDINNDGVIDGDDSHAIDELDEGEHYPVHTSALFSPGQGNLNVVSGDNSAVRVINSGTIIPGSSYGAATIASGRLANNVDISVSLENMASGTSALTVSGGLNPVETLIFSPAGVVADGNYRIPFNQEESSDLFFITLDSSSRPSRSEDGVQYLVRPINQLTEVAPEATFANVQIKSSQFGDSDSISISAIPVGVNADSSLEKESTFHLIFFTGTASQVMFPFESVIGFSKPHHIGVVQLIDPFGSPILAAKDIVIQLSSSKSGSLSVPSVTIPQGRSFATFDVITSGKLEGLTISASAEGVHATSNPVSSVLANLEGSFVTADSFVTTVPSAITVSTIEGATVLWGAPPALEVTGKDDKAVFYDSATNSYIADMMVVTEEPGSYVIDVTLLKDGFKPTTISSTVVFDPFLIPLNVSIEYGTTSVGYKQPTTMTVRVVDVNLEPVSGATVTVTTDPDSTVAPATGTTSSSGIANFVYTPGSTSPMTNLDVTVSKDGYLPGTDSLRVEVSGVPTNLPFWVTYAAVGGVVASIGGGLVYFMKKPKGKRLDEEEEGLDDEEDEEI